MTVKLLPEHHLELLSLNGGCTGWSESTLVKMSNCWKTHAAAHMLCDCSKLFQKLILFLDSTGGNKKSRILL